VADIIKEAKRLCYDNQISNSTNKIKTTWKRVAYRGGVSTLPPPEIPKALQNHAKLNPIVKTVKNCWI